MTRLSHLQDSQQCTQDETELCSNHLAALQTKYSVARPAAHTSSLDDNLLDLFSKSKKIRQKINIFSSSLFPVFSANIEDHPQASDLTSKHPQDWRCPCSKKGREGHRRQSNCCAVDSQTG